MRIPKKIRSSLSKPCAKVMAGDRYEAVVSIDCGTIAAGNLASVVKEDRRAALLQASIQARQSMAPEFVPMGASEIMDFLRD